MSAHSELLSACRFAHTQRIWLKKDECGAKVIISYEERTRRRATQPVLFFSGGQLNIKTGRWIGFG
jgi:hypothetical protein